MRMQICHAIMIGIETVKGLQIMRIDLSAIFAANISLLLLLLLLQLLAIERVVAAHSMELMLLLLRMIERVKVLQVCHIVAQMLIMRIGVVLLLLLGTIFHWQWRWLLL